MVPVMSEGGRGERRKHWRTLEPGFPLRGSGGLLCPGRWAAGNPTGTTSLQGHYSSAQAFLQDSLSVLSAEWGGQTKDHWSSEKRGFLEP